MKTQFDRWELLAILYKSDESPCQGLNLEANVLGTYPETLIDRSVPYPILHTTCHYMDLGLGQNLCKNSKVKDKFLNHSNQTLKRI